MRYRGYTITNLGNGFDISHPTLDVGCPYDDSLAPSAASAKQWIDEDIRCRKEK
jgi:hypothetical protein